MDIPTTISARNSHTPRTFFDLPRGRAQPSRYWTESERESFEVAVKLHKTDYKSVSEHVGSRTPAQVRSHARKYYKKLVSTKKQSLNSKFLAPLLTFARSRQIRDFKRSSGKTKAKAKPKKMRDEVAGARERNPESSWSKNHGAAGVPMTMVAGPYPPLEDGIDRNRDQIDQLSPTSTLFDPSDAFLGPFPSESHDPMGTFGAHTGSEDALLTYFLSSSTEEIKAAAEEDAATLFGEDCAESIFPPLMETAAECAQMDTMLHMYFPPAARHF